VDTVVFIVGGVCYAGADMKILHALALLFFLSCRGVTAEAEPDAAARVKSLLEQYAQDDQRLAGTRHYVKTTVEGKEGTLREEAWELETGEVIKVAKERKQGAGVTLEEYSLTGQELGYAGSVYFGFRRVEERQTEGGTRVTEARSYFDGAGMAAKRRRIVNLPAGTSLELSTKLKFEELVVKSLPEDEQRGSVAAQAAEAIAKEVVEEKWLVGDPAKDAPAEWQRFKLVRETSSPDGRYALAISPKKKKFDWDDFQAADLGPRQYMIEGEDPQNFIVDLRTHLPVGKTLGEHYGNRPRYNHNVCTMVWSPDSRNFLQITESKWSFNSCGLGRVENGKWAGVVNLGDAVVKYGAAFLVKTKNAIYRKNAKEMSKALSEPDLENDGTGSIKVFFQVIKADYVTVAVRFRLVSGKQGLHVEMLGAKLVAD
jgi:hypothetical protein